MLEVVSFKRKKERLPGHWLELTPLGNSIQQVALKPKIWEIERRRATAVEVLN
jgi:hypothetical protein